ncbi:MAG TPA: lipopolysaccharide heptosyltransferase II [Blastocatellia bacterium]|nr:lipopolysaccharide heptosyltransferase II [Blastocatellia bacterium]
MNEESPHPRASFEPNSSPASVLIRAPNWVGDAVMAIPALRELRRIFIGSHVTIAARSWVQGLFDGEGLGDNLISLDHARGRFSSSANFLNEARRFRRERFDFAILLTNSFATALAARAGGTKQIAGYPTDARRLLLDHVIPFEPDHKSLHQVRYYLNIAAQIEASIYGKSNIDMQGSEPRLEVSKEQRQHARSLLGRFNIGAVAGQGALLVINPGATNSSAKRWPAERFAKTADRLNEVQGFQTIIVGTAGDKSVAEAVARHMRSPVAVIAGQTSIAELKGVLAWARLVISNDTGTSHVSAALGVPTVVVFGPTEHVSTRPLSRRAAVVRHDVECSPCMLRECPIDHRCMTRVEVDDVYAAAQTLLVSAAG